MNLVWTSFIIISLAIMLFTNADLALATMLNGSEKAIALSIKLWAIYALWLGILNILENTGLHIKIANLLKPITSRLIGNYDPYTQSQIGINLTSNFLGMGNACVPSGINAIKGMDNKSGKITSGMITFLILNTTSLQILPTTIIGLRIANGSTNANSIILPTIIATSTSTIIGVALCKLLEFLKRKFSKQKQFNFVTTNFNIKARGK